MKRDIGIQRKSSAKNLPAGDPNGKISANDVNILVRELENSEVAGTADKLMKERLGNTNFDLALRYNLAKEI